MRSGEKKSPSPHTISIAPRVSPREEIRAYRAYLKLKEPALFEWFDRRGDEASHGGPVPRSATD
jgi:hypothetical protein